MYEITENMTDEAILEIATLIQTTNSENKMEEISNLYLTIKNFSDKDRIENLVNNHPIIYLSKIDFNNKSYDMEYANLTEEDRKDSSILIDLMIKYEQFDIDNTKMLNILTDWVEDDQYIANERKEERRQGILKFINAKMKVKGEDSLSNEEKAFLLENVLN